MSIYYPEPLVTMNSIISVVTGSLLLGIFYQRFNSRNTPLINFDYLPIKFKVGLTIWECIDNSATAAKYFFIVLALIVLRTRFYPAARSTA